MIAASAVIEVAGPGTAPFLAHSPSLGVHSEERRKGGRKVEGRKVRQRGENLSYPDIHKAQKLKCK